MKSPKDMRILQIDITNACVHQCSNCTRFCGHHKKNFFMDFETFKRAVDSFDGYVGTIGVMGGEPTLHPEFEKFSTYLDSKIKDEDRKKVNNFIYPQTDFMMSMHNQEQENTILYNYRTGMRESVKGAGLWSAMVKSYKKNYEVIQDIFKMQAVNDHGNIMYHSPIMITRKDLGIPDDEWIKIRDNCWAQDVWSASITPKGAFFCEIAGALDMLFDGPGGWPIEPGWWKREPEEFGDQLKWCELCGIAIETFTRDANEEIDDMSQTFYEKLKEIESPKLKRNLINIVKIENGKITEESKNNVKEVRKAKFYDNFESRFNQDKSILFPEKFIGILVLDDTINFNIEEIINNIEINLKQLDELKVLSQNAELSNNLNSKYSDSEKVKIIHSSNQSFGFSLNYILQKVTIDDYIILFTQNILLKDSVGLKLKKCVINPGTLHYIDFSKELVTIENEYIQNYENMKKGYCALFNKNAISLRQIGFDRIANSDSFNQIKDLWIKEKIVEFSNAMNYECPDNHIEKGLRYVVYGTGSKACYVTDLIKQKEADIICYSDSNEEKWGKEFSGKEIVSPKTLLEIAEKYDKIVIGSSYYSEIKRNLNSLGISDNKLVLIE